MINFKLITQALEKLLIENLDSKDYNIERNPMRPSSAEKAADKAWIGIYRGSIEYIAHSTGSQPWLAQIETIVEIQVASLTSAEDCEDKLCDAEKEVLDLLTNNKKIGGTIDMTNGFSVEYEINADEQTFYQAAIITIRGEQRA
jgi:hypothetical protein